VTKVNVLLPAGYDDHPHRRYPVLWLLHGANGGADNWLPGITELAEGFPGIVVMPDGGLFGMYVNWWNDGTRGEPAWATYHLRTVRTAVEHRFRIRPGRRWHAVAGISMGGQGALRYAALLPGYFGTVVGFSAALPDMQSDVAQSGLTSLASLNGASGTAYEAIFGPAAAPYAEGNSPQALAANLGHTRVYLTSGNGTNCPEDPEGPTFTLDAATETVLNAQQAPFAAAVRKAGADVTEVTTCGVHTFGVWDRAFAAARQWGFFKAPPGPIVPDRWTYRTVAQSGAAWGLRYRFAEPPTEVATFRREGHTLSATGHGTVHLTGFWGCDLTLDLPFREELPLTCTLWG
jgi:S-formylglutathione hydrolase FrmB